MYFSKLIMEVASHICPVQTLRHYSSFQYMNVDQFISTLFDLKPLYSSIFYVCYWGRKQIPEEFRPILHDRGICYTFNALDSSKIYRNGR